MNNDDLIREHYRTQAEESGDSSLSTIGERVVREKEVALIRDFLAVMRRKNLPNPLRILDAGCGNGYTLSQLVGDFPAWHFHGVEFTEELLSIAQNRGLNGCEFNHGDIRHTEYGDGFFDVIYTERCLINILDGEQQKQALEEIARILKPSGYYLMIECFTDGLENNNKARRETGLSEIKPAYHNLYFDKEKLFDEVQDLLRVVDPSEFDPDAGPHAIQSNFLSSHFFVARVLHPLITKGEWVRNTEFVKFFSFLPPVGNYAPIQAYILSNRAG